MNNKKISSLTLLALLGLGLSLGLSGCLDKGDKKNEKKVIDGKMVVEQDFDQDNDPYPDEYLLNGDLKSSQKMDSIKKQLETAFPGMKVEGVSKGPVPYLYQVKAADNIYFTTKDGKLIFAGDLIDLKNTKTNYTEQARTKGRSAILKTLNPKDTINFDPKNPKYTITVFTDTDCGYCRKFHEHIKEVNALGIAVHYAAFPRAGLQSKTFDTMQTIWCSKDRQTALTDVKSGKELPIQSCTTHDIPMQYNLGQKMGIRGTPALILQDGTLIPGYMPPDKLKEMLDKHFEKKQA